MTHRREDESLITWLRGIESRVDRLEKGDKGVRQNDIRIGDILISADEDSTQLKISRLVDGDLREVGNIQGTLRLRFVGYGTELPDTTPHEGDVFIVLEEEETT